MQLSAEISLLVAEAVHYDELLEQVAVPIALHTGGGCVIALLSDDASTLTPFGVFHPDPDAHAALTQLSGGAYTPLGGLEDLVLGEGRGRRVELRPEIFADRPGVPRYIELTGHREAILVPMRAWGRSRGVLWASRASDLEQDDVNFLSLAGSRLALAVDHLRLLEGDSAPPRPRVDGPTASLTDREREILAHIGEGLTSREIAERLVVSVRTVEWHRSRIQGKLEVSGRSELTRIAREAGLSA